jgi:SOS-response transcriptional repressor LexA
MSDWINKVGPAIRQARKARGLTLENVATKAGTDTGNLSRWERGIQSMSLAMLDAVAEAVGISSAELFGSVFGRQMGNTKGEDGASGMSAAAIATWPVPLISTVQAGHWSEIRDNFQPREGEKLVYSTKSVGPHAYALRIRGDSMEPRLTEGQIVIVDPDVSPHHGRIVVVRQDDSAEATIKQLVVEGSDQYLKPLNSRYPIMRVTQQATFCGVVVQAIDDDF